MSRFSIILVVFEEGQAHYVRISDINAFVFIDFPDTAFILLQILLVVKDEISTNEIK